MIKKISKLSFNEVTKTLKNSSIFLGILLSLIPSSGLNAQSLDSLSTKKMTFSSEGINLAGSIYQPKKPQAALVIVHGSGQEVRMTEFAELLAKNGFLILSYDKRGVGESEGIYAGPEVGTNNIDSTNLNLLAKDASAAVNTLHEMEKNIPIGLIGFSQAGWIIPIVADKNPLVEFMVLFSCPTITSMEQLRFQFYTDGDKDFWKNHTEEEVREHIKNDPDRYQFVTSDPKISLSNLSIPGLWIFGEKDIQIPVGLCMEQLNTLKAKGSPFDYVLFSELGHNTAFTNSSEPFDISLHWIKHRVLDIRNIEKENK